MEERIRYLLRLYENNKCTREELEELFNHIRNLSNSDAPLKRMVKNVYNEILKNHPSFTYVDENGRLILTEPEYAPMFSNKVVAPKMYRKTLVVIVLATGLLSVILWLVRKDISFPGILYQGGSQTLTKKFSERSEHKLLLLSDSTEVWLNAASSLEFPEKFTGNKREVNLNGEALFKVKRADIVPFIIHTGNISTTVLGTSFNIKAYLTEDEVIVSASKGKAEVKRNHNIIATLNSGQQVKINNAEERIARKDIDPSHVGAWQKGDMLYDEERFINIVSDLERIYNVNISFSNEKAQPLKISVSFKKDIGAKQALHLLCGLTGTKLHYDDQKFAIE